MKTGTSIFVALAAGLVATGPALADSYSDTVERFKNAGQSASLFADAYGYAVFPALEISSSVYKDGLVFSRVHGTGRVYVGGEHIGDTSKTHYSDGYPLDGEGFSEIVFFKDAAALEAFKSGEFEFGARDASNAGEYYRGVATLITGASGLTYDIAATGQEFTFTPVR